MDLGQDQGGDFDNENLLTAASQSVITDNPDDNATEMTAPASSILLIKLYPAVWVQPMLKVGFECISIPPTRLKLNSGVRMSSFNGGAGNTSQDSLSYTH